jgi:hypothetical protein
VRPVHHSLERVGDRGILEVAGEGHVPAAASAGGIVDGQIDPLPEPVGSDQGGDPLDQQQTADLLSCSLATYTPGALAWIFLPTIP